MQSAEADPGTLPDSTAVWLIRHGETAWSRQGKHTGRTDVPLTPTGEQQADALRPMLAGIHPALVMSSPLCRARETARLAGLPVDLVLDDLAEWDYGDYEGLTGEQIRQRVPGWTLFTHGVTGGETVHQVSDRADRVLALARSRVAEGPIVLFAHGHISRIMAARWIGLSADAGANFALGTAAPSVLGAQYGAAMIDRWNLPVSAAPRG